MWLVLFVLPYHDFSVLGLTHLLSLFLWKSRCLPTALFPLSHVLISIWGPQCPGRKGCQAVPPPRNLGFTPSWLGPSWVRTWLCWRRDLGLWAFLWRIQALCVPQASGLFWCKGGPACLTFLWVERQEDDQERGRKLCPPCWQSKTEVVQQCPGSLGYIIFKGKINQRAVNIYKSASFCTCIRIPRAPWRNLVELATWNLHSLVTSVAATEKELSGPH